MAAELSQDVAEANLARNLADRIEREWLKNGHQGSLTLDPSISLAVLKKALFLFGRLGLIDTPCVVWTDPPTLHFPYHGPVYKPAK